MRPVGYTKDRLRNVFVASIGSRIRALYEGLPEAGQSTPCVDPELALQPKAFEGFALGTVLGFSLSAGAGSGISDADPSRMAVMLHKVVRVASNGHGVAVTETSPRPYVFAASLRGGHDRVLDAHGWMHLPITTGGSTYTFYHRDLLEVAISAVCGTNLLDLDGWRHYPSAEGWTRSSHTMNADVFLQE